MLSSKSASTFINMNECEEASCTTFFSVLRQTYPKRRVSRHRRQQSLVNNRSRSFPNWRCRPFNLLPLARRWWSRHLALFDFGRHVHVVDRKLTLPDALAARCLRTRYQKARTCEASLWTTVKNRSEPFQSSLSASFLADCPKLGPLRSDEVVIWSGRSDSNAQSQLRSTLARLPFATETHGPLPELWANCHADALFTRSRMDQRLADLWEDAPVAIVVELHLEHVMDIIKYHGTGKLRRKPQTHNTTPHKPPENPKAPSSSTYPMQHQLMPSTHRRSQSEGSRRYPILRISGPLVSSRASRLG